MIFSNFISQNALDRRQETPWTNCQSLLNPTMINTQSFSFHTYKQFKSPVCLIQACLDCGRKLMQPTCKLYTETQSGISSFSFSFWITRCSSSDMNYRLVLYETFLPTMHKAWNKSRLQYLSCKSTSVSFFPFFQSLITPVMNWNWRTPSLSAFIATHIKNVCCTTQSFTIHESNIILALLRSQNSN